MTEYQSTYSPPLSSSNLSLLLATETGYWPLWESVNGVITLSKRGARYERPENRKPFSDYMDLQGRYAQVDEKLLDLAFEDIEYEWQWVRRFMSEL
ncbi:MAG: hypothetical protein INQ03_02670 [Candidatus Heimdallarchaeota archaeon]|nr:hypothetical protein [Candidatus Heimdallarchaeota archaeon]